MSDTAYLFILAGIWSLVAAVIVRFIPKRPAKIIVFTLLVGVPFWELPFGYINFRSLCHEEGGLRVFAGVSPQEVVCVKYPIEYSAGRFLELGFNAVDAIDRQGKLSRTVKSSSARPAEPSAYCVTQAFVQGLPWRIQRNEYSVERNSDLRVVARASDFVWYGTWWQQAALPVLGRGGECRHGDLTPAIAKLLIDGAK